MSSLEELLYQHVAGDGAIAERLAKFGNQPAVFEILAPPDTDSGWTGAQTPRIEFSVLRQEDPERRVSGQVSVSILHRGDSMVEPAAIEARLRTLLDGATYRPDEGTASLRWSRAAVFDQEPDYRGVEVVYDLIAWPSGLTYEPDPVAALRTWAQVHSVQLQVDPQTWSPADATPALYWRLAGIEGVAPTQWGAWVTCRLAGHILAPSPGVRLEWTRRVVEALALTRRVTMSDGSPLIIQSIGANSDADTLRVGQIRLTARFGVLGPAPTDPTIQHAHITGAAEGEVN